MSSHFGLLSLLFPLFIPAEKYSLILSPEGSPSVFSIRHHQSVMSSHTEEPLVSSWWCKIYTTVLRGTRKIESLSTLFVSEKIEFMKKGSSVHICQKRIIYVNTGWKELAREYYIKLVLMGRWCCISEILIVLSMRVNIKIRIHVECRAMLPVPLCSDPVTDINMYARWKNPTTYVYWNVIPTCKQYLDLPQLSLVSVPKYFNSD